MEFKKFEKSNIFYIILIDEYKLEPPFLAPKNVNPNSIDFLKFLPKNIYQLEDPLFYLSYEINTLSSNPNSVVFFKRNDEKRLIEFVLQANAVIVFLIDENKLTDRNIKDKINQLEKQCIFYINLAENESKDGESINIFFNEIVHNRAEISKYLGIDQEEHKNYMSVEYNLNEIKHYNYFSPTKTNFLLYNTYLGNFSYPYEITKDKMQEHAKKAMTQSTTFNRLNLFLPQLKAFDNLYNSFKKTRSPKKFYLEYNPIYFSLPFHNPDIKDFFPDKSSVLAKKIFKALQVEQTSNYVNVIESKDEDLALYHSAMQVLKERLTFLDNSSFLMSSFNFAPNVRFPILGKSIYRELSFIGPNNFNKFLTLKSQLKLSDTISKIGNKISKSILSDEFKKYLKNRNSQIVSLTDLPIEWLEIDEVPLCFSHDITRLPETNFNNHLNSFAFNSLIDFSIKKNIINKTLVILGANDDEFIKWHKLIFDLAKKESFIVEICTNINELIHAIKKHNPEFLIIDTHGGFDEVSKQTYLKIGKEKLTQDIIILNNISAPLIFLSACGTAPTYGTFNPIANSFLQMGAKSVTSTYLPVEIDNSTMVYLGILNNLNKVSNEGTFENWLEYICYNIRSSYLHRIYTPLMLDSKIDNKEENDYYNYIQNIQNFNQRKVIYKATKKFEKALPKKKKNGFIPRPYEFLYYTNIGRGDLVLFEKYKELYDEINYS